MRNLLTELRVAVILTVIFVALLCGVYPVAVLVLARSFFPDKANGSIVLREGTVAGSSLLGQTFTEPRYFHPRPSAAGQGYDAAASGGSNLGPLSKRLIDTVRQRVAQYRTENRLDPGTLVPADAVTASGSGLDPHISVKNALLQAPRVAQARGCELQSVIEQVRRQTEGRTFGVLGEPRVNVFLLNLALDAPDESRKS